MSEPQSSSPPSAAAPNPSADAQAGQRVSELQTQVATLQQEVLSLQGKLRNRDPKLLEKLKAENEELSKRFDLLKKAVFAIMSESYQPRTADELKLQYEILRKATVEYCTKAKIDPELWKSIAS